MTEKQKQTALRNLRKLLNNDTQVAVGNRLGYTGAYVSMVVNGKAAMTDAFANAVSLLVRR